MFGEIFLGLLFYVNVYPTNKALFFFWDISVALFIRFCLLTDVENIYSVFYNDNVRLQFLSTLTSDKEVNDFLIHLILYSGYVLWYFLYIHSSFFACIGFGADRLICSEWPFYVMASGWYFH